jgi:deoxycytidylate deaminase
MYYNFNMNQGYESVSNTIKVRSEGLGRVGGTWKTRCAGRTYSTATHQLVIEAVGMSVEASQVIHHCDERITNNAPGNLKIISRGEHTAKHGTGRVVSEALRQRLKAGSTKAWALKMQDKEFASEMKQHGAASMTENWANKSFRDHMVPVCKANGRQLAARTNSDPKAISARRRGSVLAGLSRVIFLSNGSVTADNYEAERLNYACKHRSGEKGPQAPRVPKVLEVFSTLSEVFAEAKTYNHKVISVVPIAGAFPVYDLTVPGYENFAIDLGDNSCVFVHNCKSVHAEANAIIQAARHGVATLGATLYVTGAPCLMCARAIVNAGIAEVVFMQDRRYNPEDSLGLLGEAGVRVREL